MSKYLNTSLPMYKYDMKCYATIHAPCIIEILSVFYLYNEFQNYKKYNSSASKGEN